MKKITKSLMTLLLLFVALSANASYQIALGTKFTSVESLKGKVFAIADETAGKAFYGPTGGYGHEVGFDVYSTAFSNDVNYYYFKLVDIPADSVTKYPELAGYTLIRACKADGSLYTFWGDGNNGYLNTNNGSLFLLGITAKFFGQDFDYGAVWKVEYVADKGFTIKSKYTEDKYLKDAGAPKNEEATYFTFAEVSSVEIFDPDTSDPGVGEIPNGYMSLITNGTFEGEDVSSFFTKVNKGNPAPSTIINEVGRNNGHGIKITTIDNATDGWDTQFWVVFNKELKSGDVVHVEFDYRSSEPTSVSSQEHSQKCSYVWYAGLNGFKPHLNWDHFSQDFTISKGENNAEITVGSIAFNLNDTKNKVIDIYFDNFLVYTKKVDPITEWTELVTDASYVVKEQGVNLDPWLTSLDNDEIAVKSADGATQDWDTQFFVKLSKKLPKGTPFKFSIDYKADKDAYVYMQSHKEPGAYSGNGNYGDFTCGTSYKTHSKGTNDDYPTIGDDGIWTIALNLSNNKSETNFNFKKISFMIPTAVYNGLEDAPAADAKPVPTLTVGAKKYATVRLPYSVNINSSDVKAYCVSYANGVISLGDEVNALPAGTAVLLKAESAGDFTQGIEIARVLNSLNTGLLAASTDESKPTKGDGATIYVLADGNHGVGFYLLANNVEIPAGKGYLVIEASAEGREFIGFADDATTIKAVENLKKSGMIFNLAGQQVKKAQKGIYIIDGKKAIVK